MNLKITLLSILKSYLIFSLNGFVKMIVQKYLSYISITMKYIIIYKDSSLRMAVYFYS